jgi:hypothetical protein
VGWGAGGRGGGCGGLVGGGCWARAAKETCSAGALSCQPRLLQNESARRLKPAPPLPNRRARRWSSTATCWSAPRRAPRSLRCSRSRSSPLMPRASASSRSRCTTQGGAWEKRGGGGAKRARRQGVGGRRAVGGVGKAGARAPPCAPVCLPPHPARLARPIRPPSFMRLDAAAQRALHVFPARGDANAAFSLYGLMCRARTPMGKRRLKVRQGPPTLRPRGILGSWGPGMPQRARLRRPG